MNGRRFGFAGAAAFFLAAALVFPPAGAAHPPDAEKSLVILFSHDLHSYFLPHAKVAPAGDTVERGGWARIATLIRDEKARNANGVLVLDGGDFSIGSIFHTLFMRECFELRLLGAMGYDAAALGNHEFDFHLDGLASALRAAKAAGGPLPAVLASNTTFPEGDGAAAFRDYPVLDHFVLERGGLRIGLFGLMGKDAGVDSPFASPATFGDPIIAARRIVDVLRNREKVDLIVALSHSGTSSDPSRSEDETLAREVPGIDVIVSGHTHTLLSSPKMMGRTLIVSAGYYGEQLGRLELTWTKEGGARLLAYELIPVDARIAEDAGIAAKIAGFRAIVERDYLEPLGFRADQVLAESAFTMETPEAIEASGADSGLGDLITDAFRWAVAKAEGPASDFVAVGIEPVGNIHDTFLSGPISVEETFRVLSLGRGEDGNPGYDLVATYLKGSEIRRLLEVTASIAPSKTDARLQFSGIRFTYNPHRLVFDRVVDVSISRPDGSYAPLESKTLYRVCFDSYAAQMVDYISNASYGILKMQPRDRTGAPLGDFRKSLVDADPAKPGLQNLKQWVALAEYLRSLPDRDGNGIPDIPERYRKAEGRYQAVPSWNPVRLLIGGNGITYAVLGIAVLLAALVVFIVRRIRRRRRSRRAVRRAE